MKYVIEILFDSDIEYSEKTMRENVEKIIKEMETENVSVLRIYTLEKKQMIKDKLISKSYDLAEAFIDELKRRLNWLPGTVVNEKLFRESIQAAVDQGWTIDEMPGNIKEFPKEWGVVVGGMK